MKQQDSLFAIAMAIRLRDNSDSYGEEELRGTIVQLTEKNVFSIRQISNMCGKSPATLSRIVQRTSRTGGKLNPQHLEEIRDLIFQQDIDQVDWQTVKKITSDGTSADMLSRISGIPKSTIHRKISSGHLRQERQL